MFAGVFLVVLYANQLSHVVREERNSIKSNLELGSRIAEDSIFRSNRSEQSRTEVKLLEDGNNTDRGKSAADTAGLTTE